MSKNQIERKLIIYGGCRPVKSANVSLQSMNERFYPLNGSSVLTA